MAGMMLADDRRTASVWFVAAGVQDDCATVWLAVESSTLALQ
jgi:hypothetical protein